MGVLRCILALAVAVKHINAPKILHLCDSALAVQVFFMISGFYMAMIYKNYHSKVSFLISRYLRIYPVYFICCILTLLVYPVDRYLDTISYLPLSGIIILCCTQVLLFFQDITLWLSWSAVLDILYWTNNLGVALHKITILKQAWSLGVELSFYLLTPFIINHTKRLWIVVCVGLSVLACLLSIDLLPVRYHSLLPISCIFFALGALSFHHKEMLIRWNIISPVFSLFFLVMYLVFYDHIPGGIEIKNIIFCVVFCVLLPVIFQHTNRSMLDRFIGNLSYPIYCTHIFVAYIIYPPSVGRWFLQNSEFQWSSTISFTNAMEIIIGTIIFSAMLHILVERPMDKMRKKFKQGI